MCNTYTGDEMDFKISEEQRQLRQEVIDFAKNCLNEKGTLEKFTYEMWNKVAEMGLLGITIGEEYGGLNESYLTAAIIFEALGYACKNNGFVFAINNHIWVAQNLIYLYGSQCLKEKYVKTMVEGKKIGAIAITEADAGSDALNMRTTAVEEEDCYVLNGSKMFISNGPIADILIVFAVTNESPAKKITAFVVETDNEGVQIGADIEKMGLGGCPTAEVTFCNCKVPKKNILGKLNSGTTIMNAALEWERCYEFVPHIGAMERIMERCIEHARTRVQFKKNIGANQAISSKIADMKISIELAKLMLYKIAWMKDNGKKAFTETSIFKVFVSENYIKTCQNAIQIFGGYGYTKEYELERELRDAIACSIYSGTNELQRNTIYDMADL